MSELIVVQDNCVTCGGELSAADNFCRNCGASSAMALPDSRGVAPVPNVLVIAPPTQRSVVDEALSNRMVVVAILLVAGPIGLPALWFSPSFSRRAKIATSVIYFLLTTILPLAIVWYFMDVALRPLVDVFRGS